MSISTRDVEIYLKHADVNGDVELRIDDKGNSNIEKLETGQLEFMKTVVDRTGLGLEWRKRIVQGLKDIGDTEVRAFADFGGAGAAIRFGSIAKALYDSNAAFTLRWKYGAAANAPSITAHFHVTSWPIDTTVGEQVMTSLSISFAGDSAPVFANF